MFLGILSVYNLINILFIGTFTSPFRLLYFGRFYNAFFKRVLLYKAFSKVSLHYNIPYISKYKTKPFCNILCLIFWTPCIENLKQKSCLFFG